MKQSFKNAQIKDLLQNPSLYPGICCIRNWEPFKFNTTPSSSAKGRGCSELSEEATGFSRTGLSSQPHRSLLWPWPNHLNTLRCLVICKISILLFTYLQEIQRRSPFAKYLETFRGNRPYVMSAGFLTAPWAGSCKSPIFNWAWRKRPQCHGVSRFWTRASSWDGYFSGLVTKHCFLEAKLNHLCKQFCGLSHDLTYFTLEITK